jgi:death on curing protein
MAIIYLTLEQAKETHRRTVEVSGGGSYGLLNMGQLESVLENIQHDGWYPTLLDKLTHLFYAANKFHCFEDGNKRIAISLCTQMLTLNGYVFISPFIRIMENVSYHVASGAIDKELLREIFDAVLNDEFDENEELKLRYVNATSEPN